MHLCYYVTSHGYGHSVRAAAICQRLAPDTRLTLRTTVPETFLREELRRPFACAPAEFDCGCLQSDSVTVDIAATVARYTALAAANAQRIDSEAAWLRANAVDCVACDIPPLPFEAAARAGVPSVAVANFTWHDIYREYLGRHPRFGPAVAAMRGQYAAAGLLLEVAPALPMEYFGRRRGVGVVGRPGRNVRRELIEQLGLPADTRLALVYLGTFGLDMDWRRLERFRDWTFLSADPLPDAPRNLVVFDKQRLRFCDVNASADLVVAKLGYGIYSGCLLDGAPLLYLPRDDFAEFPALARGIREWGHGYCLDKDDFRALRWEAVLRAVEQRPRPRPVESDGAAACARAIEEFAGTRGSGAAGMHSGPEHGQPG